MVEADLSADHDEDQVGTLEHAIHCRKTSHLENPASFPLLRAWVVVHVERLDGTV